MKKDNSRPGTAFSHSSGAFSPKIKIVQIIRHVFWVIMLLLVLSLTLGFAYCAPTYSSFYDNKKSYIDDELNIMPLSGPVINESDDVPGSCSIFPDSIFLTNSLFSSCIKGKATSKYTFLFLSLIFQWNREITFEESIISITTSTYSRCKLQRRCYLRNHVCRSFEHHLSKHRRDSPSLPYRATNHSQYRNFLHGSKVAKLFLKVDPSYNSLLRYRRRHEVWSSNSFSSSMYIYSYNNRSWWLSRPQTAISRSLRCASLFLRQKTIWNNNGSLLNNALQLK